ncbi:hypothetical protein [Streptomyces sp. NPDC097619]|uniref:hypothetical protein n=1 Tax=Streptomyces sp. NPDC097619 TaxID=3157228 RepID=UPI00333487D8
MGSLRNPVGPLPSSIYWRRRAVLASVAALLAMLAVWAVTSGGGQGSQDAKGPGPGPSAGITPGPDPSGSPVTNYPGGREDSGGGDHGGTGTTAGSGSSTGGDGNGTDTGTGGTDPGSGKNGEPGGGTGTAGSTGGSGGAGQLPAGSPLPTCAPGAVSWEVRTVKNEYEPTEFPRFEIVAKNSSVGTCKMDLGPKNAVLTITKTGADRPVWSTADCPRGTGNAFYRVPARSSVTHVVEWDRKPGDATRCAAPPKTAAEPGTYLVEVKAPGMKDLTVSFRLEQD